MNDERLAHRNVERVDEALKRAEYEEGRDRDRVREGENGEARRLKRGADLSCDEGPVLVPSIGENSGKRGQEKRWNEPREADDSEGERGVSQPIDEPTGGGASEPGPDEGNALAKEEETVVSVA